MTDSKRLQMVKEIVADAAEKVRGTNFVYNASDIIEKLVDLLDIDITFTNTESKILAKNGYTLSKDMQTASKEYRGVAVEIEKMSYDNYVLLLCSPKIKNNSSYEVEFYDLQDSRTSKSLFKQVFQEYKDCANE